jgi:hypothetical protein
LITAVDDPVRDVRWEAAGALAEIDHPDASSRLLSAFQKRELEVIAAACRFFIRRGETGSDAVLIEALDRRGSVGTALAFINSGHAGLEQAGRRWAKTHGYQVVGFPTGDSPARWGAINK